MNLIVVMVPSFSIADDLHRRPRRRMSQALIAIAGQTELRVAQGVRRGSTVAELLMNAAEEAAGDVVVDLPERPDDVARAGGEECAGHAGHALDVVGIAANGAAGRENDQGPVPEPQARDVSGVERA